MRFAARVCLSVLALLVADFTTCAAEKTPRFTSGQYEQLMLAVNSRGTVTGYYREEQGRGVVKTCAFYLAGKGKYGEIPVVTWNERAFRGTLRALKDGVRLKIAQAHEHPGCGLVLPPQIAQGIDFARVEDAAWTELRRISSARAHFHSAPDASRVLKSFAVKGDIVVVIAQKGGWVEVEYRKKKVTTKGWIPAKTTAKLTPPEP